MINDFKNDEDIELYKEILTGKRNRFPNGYWKDINSKNIGRKLTKYMLENILNWNDEDIKNKLTCKIFSKYQLRSMLSMLYNDSYFQLINEIYPDKFKPWEFNQTFRGFWTLENAAIATKWMIEEKLNWSDDDIKEKLTGKTFCENHLCGMISNLFQTSPYDAINNAYPDKFKPWELKMSPMGIWTLKNAAIATKWMIEEKLHWSDEDIKNKLTLHTFRDNCLCGMTTIFKDSPYAAIENAYPGRFKPWELKMTPLKYWNKATAKAATKWMIEDKLKWNHKDIVTNLMHNTFNEYGLSGMMYVMFNNSTYEAIENAYPGEYKPWEFMKVSAHYWEKDENVVNAIDWIFIKEYGKKPAMKDLGKLDYNLFLKYNLNKICVHYNNSIFNIIKIYLKNKNI